MMKKSRILFVTVAMMVVVLLTGCGSGKQTSISGSGVRILMTVSSMDSFRKTLSEAAVKTAEEAGATLEVMDAEGSIEKQVKQISDAAIQGYDAILCLPVDADTAVELEAAAGDSPLIFMNGCPKEKRLEADRYMYAGSDEAVAGRLQAEYILEQFADKDEINVVIIKGEKNHSATEGRTNALKETLADSGKTINIVFEDCANWSDKEAKEMFSVFLGIGAKFDVVACNNDAMALGVIDACKEKRLNLSNIHILGIDATKEGCAAIQSGDMEFTVYQPAVGQGEAGVKLALALISGKGAKGSGLDVTEDGKYVLVPFEKVDKSNVKQYQ